MNVDCQWTNDPGSPLDLRRGADVRHLASDAMVAEDLAIRYADVTRGRRSGHFAGWEQYDEARERCMAALFTAAGAAHRVSATSVRDLVDQRPLAVDLAVALMFSVAYLLISNVVVARMLDRFPVDEPMPVVVASLCMAPVVSACCALVFGLWAGSVEMLRLGNPHISYRADRLPWGHHPLAVVGVGVLLFLAVALLKGIRRREQNNSH